MHQDAMANRKMIEQLEERLTAKDEQIELLTEAIKALAGIEDSVNHTTSKLDTTKIVQYKLQQVDIIGLQL